MDTRREFIKKAALLSGAAGLTGVLPASIERALAIDPEPGSTYLDAEHIVILMQENRSFDHCYGTLQGVRGYNDPRAIQLPNQNPVWLQSNAAGDTYFPFRLNIRETKSTWLGSLPHSWDNQVDARNNGHCDRWLIAKPSGHKELAGMPLTLGYYDRHDIPFYYSLADAFTVCDQHFCSSLTGTTPNRLYLWTGTIRAEPHAESHANVLNSDVDYGSEASWTTFPERLEDHGISWNIYQNEISVGVGFKGEEDDWLANFTDNPIEWFSQYNVRFSTGRRSYVAKALQVLPGEITALEARLGSLPASDPQHSQLERRLGQMRGEMQRVKEEAVKYTQENFDKLSQREKNLHNKAFCSNINDPHYHELTTLQYRDGDTERTVQIPKGDILHQFRQDVSSGKLPTVSWLVAPSNFSDHPGSAWYGAWYVSEVLDILTQNPEVWKKTIFILTYDENDGYFDHVPPFGAPHPRKKETGQTSKDIDPSVEFVELSQELKRKPASEARENSIGLGFRVPMVIASPWSRGGWVCSQVFDHTSPLQLMETILSHKTGRKITEPNISAWRRAVCGDLYSVFRPYRGEKIKLPDFLAKAPFIESVHKAKFKGLPDAYRRLSAGEIAQARNNPAAIPYMPSQEPGTRPSSSLPYELYAHGRLSPDRGQFEISLEAGKEVFGARSAGSPFQVYNLRKFRSSAGAASEIVPPRAYAVSAGDKLADSWALNDFEDNTYHLRVYGPNGFYREFQGSANDPSLEVRCDYEHKRLRPQALTGKIELKLINRGQSDCAVEIVDNAYKQGARQKRVRPGQETTISLSLNHSHGWYDFSVKVTGKTGYEQRFAGRVETGSPSYSDPLMGRTIG